MMLRVCPEFQEIGLALFIMVMQVNEMPSIMQPLTKCGGEAKTFQFKMFIFICYKMNKLTNAAFHFHSEKVRCILANVYS